MPAGLFIGVMPIIKAKLLLLLLLRLLQWLGLTGDREMRCCSHQAVSQ